MHHESHYNNHLYIYHLTEGLKLVGVNFSKRGVSSAVYVEVEC